MLINLIESVYRLLWGDLFTIPLGGGIGISFMVVLLFTAASGSPAAPVFCRCGWSGI
mgnify:CR=1 FL=1